MEHACLWSCRYSQGVFVTLGKLTYTTLAFIGALLAGAAQAAETASPPPPFAMPDGGVADTQAPSIEKIGRGEYRLGEIRINKIERSVIFPAEVNMDSGLLEYLIVHRRGKTHESLLRTRVEPYSLQIAFLLVGFEGAEQRLAMQGDPATPKGERVRILIRPVGGAAKAAFPAEHWLVNRFDDGVKDVGPMNWVFSGSYVDEGRFMSQESGSIVAIWHDPVALIDNASRGGESNKIWFVKQGTVPAVGTPVEVTVKSAR